MNPLFQKYNVDVIALSKDTVKQVVAHQKRDQLEHVTLLADPKLEQIKRFGLLHHKALEFYTFSVLGVPLGFPIGWNTMAVPVTLLIDEEGKVRWIDMADDYRIRGDEARIETALEEVFDSGS